MFNFMQNRLSDFLPDSEEKMMRIDIKEYASFFLFEVEIPGVSKNDVDVSITNDVLTITIKKAHEEKDEAKYIRKERIFGTHSRSFTITNIDADKIKGKYHNGVLYLRLPKQEISKPQQRNIPIE